MKRIINEIVICLVIVLSACSNLGQGEDDNISFKKGEGGLLYRIVEDNDSPKVGEIAFVSLSYKEATESGTIISQTGKLDPRPSMLFARMPEFKGDIQDALQYLSEGDSAVIKISIDSLKKNNKLKLREGDTSKFMVFNVRIHKVINKNGLTDTIYPKLIEQYKNEQALAHKATEKEKIQKYLIQKKQSYITTSSGLFVPLNLKKRISQSDKKRKVNYALFTLDGKLMDTNKEGLALSSGTYYPGDQYVPLEIDRENAPIAAFKEALSIVPAGEKVTLIIPSNLAFGSYGNNKDIPVFMPLLCEFEILN